MVENIADAFLQCIHLHLRRFGGVDTLLALFLVCVLSELAKLVT